MNDKPECKLIGEDGNVFAIIGAVKKALRRNDQADKADDFMNKAFTMKSYGDVLYLAGEYVEIV